MSLFIDSPGSVKRPGVYAVEVTPPRLIRGASNGYIGLVGKFAWGPVGSTFTPESGDDMIQTLEPPGAPRSSNGYKAIMQRLGAPWVIAGVKGSGYATATATITGTGGNLVVTAKYPGVLGNSIKVTVGAASNGDSAKRSLTITLADAVSGTKSEVFDNLTMGAAIDPALITRSRLVSAITFTGTMSAWPSNATTSLASGSDGAALTATDYDNAFALLDLEPMVRIYVADDCGDSIRATVNGNMITRVTNLTNRVAYIQGNPTNAWSAVKTDKANYTSDRVCYFGAWVMCLDDSGTLQRTPLSTFAATARANLDVNQSIAWRDAKALKYFQNIKALDTGCPFNTNSATIQEEATSFGVILPITVPGPTQGTTAGWGLLHGRDANLTSGLIYEVTRWYKDYLALSIVPALQSYVNGPNGKSGDHEIKSLVDRFMEEEKTRYQHVEDYSTDVDSVNSATSRGLGDFYLGLDAQTPGVRERLYLLLNVGETVTVRH